MSDSGQIIFAATSSAGIYRSNDTGLTWTLTEAPSSEGWVQIACNGDGTTVVGVTKKSSDNAIYYFTESSGKWTIGGGVTVYQWTSISMSGDGKYALAGSLQYETKTGGGIYLSTDQGATWTKTTAPSDNIYWAGVAVSQNGDYMYATEYNYENGKQSLPSYVYYSYDFGVSWTTANLPPLGSNFTFSTLVSTRTGDMQFAVVDTYTIYLGYNYGKNWTLLSPNDGPWLGLACSGNGQYVAATAENGVHLSEDFGVTFRQQTIDTTQGVGWLGVAMNYSGIFTVAGMKSDGGIYLGVYNKSDTPSPTLSPTRLPTYSMAPTASPTMAPTRDPRSTDLPTEAPTMQPPTMAPTSTVTATPTAPTIFPTIVPTQAPNIAPTASPTMGPTETPTVVQTTLAPTASSGSNSNSSSNKLGKGDAIVLVVFVIIGFLGICVALYFFIIKKFCVGESSLNTSLLRESTARQSARQSDREFEEGNIL
jgi:hypothetical protein